MGSVTRLIPRVQQGQEDAMNELLHRLGTDFASRVFAMLKEGHSAAAIRRRKHR